MTRDRRQRPDEQEGTKAVVRAWLKRSATRWRSTIRWSNSRPTRSRRKCRRRRRACWPRSCSTEGEAVPGAVLGRIDARGAPAQAVEPERSVERSSTQRRRPLPRPARPTSGRCGNPPLPVGPPGAASARHRSGAHHRHGPRREITRADVDRAVEARPQPCRGRSQAIAQPRVAEANGQDIPHDRMRLRDRRAHGHAVAKRRTSPRCSRPTSPRSSPTRRRWRRRAAS